MLSKRGHCEAIGHQGQTKGKSLIHIRIGEPMLRWLDEANTEKGLSIHRRKFVKEVEDVYKEYVKELEKPTSLNFRRQTLEKKMKHIVELK